MFPGALLLGFFLVFAWCAEPLVFDIELSGLLEDPTASVGMISWFVGVAVNLAESIQHPV